MGGDDTFTITEGALGSKAITTTLGNGSTTYENVPPGTYTFGENAPAGWVNGGFGGDCAADGSITVGAGDTKTCSLTNT